MKRWYVGYFYHGYLKQLNLSFEKHSDRFKDVKLWYPKLTEIVAKDGVKQEKKTPMFENYVLFQFDEDSTIWTEILRFTPIIKFLKDDRNRPIPLEAYEVLHLVELESKKTTKNYSIFIGEDVYIKNGPYKGLTGKCQSIIKGKYMARVSINMFGVVEKQVEINLEYLEFAE